MVLLERTLDGFPGMARLGAQKRFHRAFTAACLPIIYGHQDFEKHRDRILATAGLERVETEVLICTPRRWGKTTSVAMFCAALLCSVEDMWISCFSTGQRASTSLLDLVAKLVRSLPGGASRILKKNQEQLFLRGSSAADTRRMFSYPSSVSGLKGVGGKVIILEEASQVRNCPWRIPAPLNGCSEYSCNEVSAHSCNEYGLWA